MKKVLLLLFATFVAISCYDDSAIWESVNDHEARIKTLETLCNQMNTNISSLQSIIQSLQKNDYVTGAAPITEGGKTIGYTITFASGKSVTIYNGKDGADGQDGYNPVIGVKQAHDGLYYWTLNGEWILNEEGKKIPISGNGGSNGADGAPGADGITPLLKIEYGYWYVSYDSGETWTELGRATGDNGEAGASGDSFFHNVWWNDTYVYMEFADGSILEIPRQPQSSIPLILHFDLSEDIPCTPGATVTVSYYLDGVTEDVEIITMCEGFWEADVLPASNTTGQIVIKAPEDVSKGKVIVFACDSHRTTVKALSFTSGVFVTSDSVALSDKGGQVTISVSTNYEYEVSTDASWIQYYATRSVRDEDVIFNYDALPAGTVTRTAVISFSDRHGDFIKTVEVHQGSPLSLNKSSLELLVGDSEQLYATLNSSSQDLVWTTSDSGIATVDADGLVTAVTRGTAIITVSTADNKHSASCTVTVTDLSNLIYLEAHSADVTSGGGYSNGYVLAGSKLSWYLYNNSSEDIYVKYLQLIDGVTYVTSNKMTVNEWIDAGVYVGWTITLGSPYQAPHCKVVYEYKGKEYSHIAGHFFY